MRLAVCSALLFPQMEKRIQAYDGKTGTSTCAFCNARVSAADTECPNCGAALAVRDRLPAAERASWGTVGDVASMLEQGRRIDAVRMYREQTGAGLQEASAAVEALGQIEKSSTRRTYVSRASSAANLESDLWALIQMGQRARAIEVYRERTGESAQRAKDVIEVLARERGVAAGGTGCFGLMVLCLSIAVLLTDFFP